jgi:hypothetical protein
MQVHAAGRGSRHRSYTIRLEFTAGMDTRDAAGRGGGSYGLAGGDARLDANHLLFTNEHVLPTHGTRIVGQTPPYDHCNMTVVDSAPRELVEDFVDLLFGMSNADAQGRLMPGAVDRRSSGGAVPMPAGRVAELTGQVRQQPSQHPIVNRCGRVVVQIDGWSQGGFSWVAHRCGPMLRQSAGFRLRKV